MIVSYLDLPAPNSQWTHHTGIFHVLHEVKNKSIVRIIKINYISDLLWYVHPNI